MPEVIVAPARTLYTVGHSLPVARWRVFHLGSRRRAVRHRRTPFLAVRGRRLTSGGPAR